VSAADVPPLEGDIYGNHFESHVMVRKHKRGNPRLDIARKRSAVTRSAQSDAFALSLRPVIVNILKGNPDASLREIARELDRRGISTMRRRKWDAGVQLRLLMLRLERLGRGV
jgi:hypothetical protein